MELKVYTFPKKCVATP